MDRQLDVRVERVGWLERVKQLVGSTTGVRRTNQSKQGRHRPLCENVFKGWQKAALRLAWLGVREGPCVSPLRFGPSGDHWELHLELELGDHNPWWWCPVVFLHLCKRAGPSAFKKVT